MKKAVIFLLPLAIISLTAFLPSLTYASENVRFSEWLYTTGETHHFFSKDSEIFSELDYRYIDVKKQKASQDKCRLIKRDIIAFRNFLVEELNSDYLSWYTESYIPSLSYLYRSLSGEKTVVALIEMANKLMYMNVELDELCASDVDVVPLFKKHQDDLLDIDLRENQGGGIDTYSGVIGKVKYVPFSISSSKQTAKLLSDAILSRNISSHSAQTLLENNTELFSEVQSIADIFGGILDIKTTLEFADGSVISYRSSVGTENILPFSKLTDDEDIDFDFEVSINIQELAETVEANSEFFLNLICFRGSSMPIQECPFDLVDVNRSIKVAIILYELVDLNPIFQIFRIARASKHIVKMADILVGNRRPVQL